MVKLKSVQRQTQSKRFWDCDLHRTLLVDFRISCEVQLLRSEIPGATRDFAAALDHGPAYVASCRCGRVFNSKPRKRNLNHLLRLDIHVHCEFKNNANKISRLWRPFASEGISSDLVANSAIPKCTDRTHSRYSCGIDRSSLCIR